MYSTDRDVFGHFSIIILPQKFNFFRKLKKKLSLNDANLKGNYTVSIKIRRFINLNNTKIYCLHFFKNLQHIQENEIKGHLLSVLILS